MPGHLIRLTVPGRSDDVLGLPAAGAAPPHAPGGVHRAWPGARDRACHHGDRGRHGGAERAGLGASLAVRRGNRPHGHQTASAGNRRRGLVRLPAADQAGAQRPDRGRHQDQRQRAAERAIRDADRRPARGGVPAAARHRRSRRARAVRHHGDGHRSRHHRGQRHLQLQLHDKHVHRRRRRRGAHQPGTAQLRHRDVGPRTELRGRDSERGAGRLRLRERAQAAARLDDRGRRHQVHDRRHRQRAAGQQPAQPVHSAGEGAADRRDRVRSRSARPGQRS